MPSRTTQRDAEMLTAIRVCVASLCGLLALSSAIASDVVSGPKEGEKFASLKVALTTGDDAGKDIDVAERQKGKPTIVVFVQAERWDRPMARFLRTLDQELVKGRADVRLVAVWLTDDVAKSKEYLPRAQQSLKLEQTDWTVFLGDKNGPPDWTINSDAHLTAVVISDNKIDATIGYRSLNETDVPAVLKKVKAKK